MDNCIFCMIANGQIPSRTVYEDEEFRVILDLNQAMKGHALILPKAHYQDLTQLPDELAAKSMILAKKVGIASMKGLGAQAFNLLQNNGALASQSVMHFHLHVLPRVPGDGDWPAWKEVSVSDEEADGIQHAILNEMR